jgi:hypothetical protein
MSKLKFGNGNAKLKGIAIFSLPAGWSCPFASDCLSKADKTTGKITDGKDTKYRCFAATSEAIYKGARNARWHNYDMLKGKSLNEMVGIITNSLPKQSIVRIHESGDFFNETYFKAWAMVASLHPNKTFYAYTKSLGYWVKNFDIIPANFKLNASEGSRQDNLIEEYGLKSAKVVFHPSEAKKLGLEIDHTDELAYKSDKSFALLLHGQQPKGSKSSEALKQLRAEDIKFGYSR